MGINHVYCFHLLIISYGILRNDAIYYLIITQDFDIIKNNYAQFILLIVDIGPYEKSYVIFYRFQNLNQIVSTLCFVWGLEEFWENSKNRGNPPVKWTDLHQLVTDIGRFCSDFYACN